MKSLLDVAYDGSLATWSTEKLLEHLRTAISEDRDQRKFASEVLSELDRRNEDSIKFSLQKAAP